MADRCPICRRALRPMGADWADAFCARGPAEIADDRYHPTAGTVECLNLGIESRNKIIAAAKELLKKQNEALTVAIEGLDQHE